MITKLFTVLILIFSAGLFSSFSETTDPPTKPFVVVLDAGHGGHDSGNIGNGYKESEIALNIVLKVGAVLEKNPNVKVIYTRKTNVFLELRERAAIANSADADLFVSVHCNAHSSAAYGTETFVLGLHKSQANFEVAKKENEVIFLEKDYEEKYAGFDPNAPESMIGLVLMQEEYLDQSILLASLVQNNIINNLKQKDRSVKQAGFWVLHNTYMPSILIETGFLTNKNEGAYLNSNKGQTEMAREITNAILSYKDNLAISTSKAQNPVIEDAEIDKAIETTEEKNYTDIIFKVQLAASGSELDTKPQNFKGLKEVSRNKEDGLFKYYYGDTSDYNKITLMKTFAQQKGYSTAYVVAFRDGKKVSLSEVLKSEDN